MFAVDLGIIFTGNEDLTLFIILDEKSFKYGKKRKFVQRNFEDEGLAGKALENLDEKQKKQAIALLAKLEEKQKRKAIVLSQQDPIIRQICRNNRMLFLKAFFGCLSLENQELYEVFVRQFANELNLYALSMIREIRFENWAITGISKVQQRFDGITSFVVNTILSIDNHENRRMMYLFFLDLATECREKCDYYNARAVSSGLENTCVERTLRVEKNLDFPPDHLSTEQLEKRKALLTLFDLRHNMINLRNLQQEVKGKVPTFIADLTIISKDLVFMKEGKWNQLSEEEKKAHAKSILRKVFYKP